MSIDRRTALLGLSAAALPSVVDAQGFPVDPRENPALSPYDAPGGGGQRVAQAAPYDPRQAPPGTTVTMIHRNRAGATPPMPGIVEAAANPLYPGGGQVRPIAFPLRPEWWGGVGDGVNDDTAAIAAAIAFAGSLEARVPVDLGGRRFRTTAELFLLSDVVLENGTLVFDPYCNDFAAINLGWRDGRRLVRRATVENVSVDASQSLRAGLRGFNFGHMARACFVSSCHAIMNNGPQRSGRRHIGFSFFGHRADTVAKGTGGYQNTLIGCSGYNCDTAFFLDTEGYGQSGYAPEMNGNRILSGAAYSCARSAVYLGHGAQENTVELRADTFIPQNGTGATIAVADILGSYNRLSIEEEIGARADTQYTIRLSGPNARYNRIEYSTQQVVTAAVRDETYGSAAGKNVVTDMGRPGSITGGDTFAVSGHARATGAGSAVHDRILMPGRAVLVKAKAVNDALPANLTHLHLERRGEAIQTFTWGSTTRPGTVRSLDTDKTAAGTIGDGFLFEEDDILTVRIEQDAAGQNAIGYTLYFKVLGG